MNTNEIQQIPLVIGVTGHRDLVDGEIPGVRARIEALFSLLKNNFPDLPLLVLTGLAEGADRLVVEVAAEFDSGIVNVLPMPKSLYELDFRDESLGGV